MTPLADGGFEDMRRGGAPVRNLPFTLPVEQRGFFLCSRERYPKLSSVGDAQRGGIQISENAGDLLVSNGTAFNLARGPGLSASGRN